MRFEREVNIYGDEVILKRFTANETSISVIQGEISAIISESELVELVDSSTTMYSKLASAIMDIDSLTINFSDLTTKYNTVSGQYTALDSKVAQYKASVDGLSANVSQISQNLENNYSTTTSMNSAIDLKINQFSTSVSQTYATKNQLNNYSTTAQMNSAINQSASSITASVASTYATKTNLNATNNRVDSLESWKNEASLKITDSAIISTVISSSSYENSVESLIAQNANSIRLKADRISWESTYSSMTENGVLSCTGARIEGNASAEDGRYILIENANYSIRTNDGSIAFFGFKKMNNGSPEDNYVIPKLVMGANGYTKNDNYFGIVTYKGNDNPQETSSAYVDIYYHELSHDDYSNIKMYSDGNIRISPVRNLEITTNYVNAAYEDMVEHRIALFSTSATDEFNSNLQIGAVVNHSNGNGLVLSDRYRDLPWGSSSGNSSKRTSIRIQTDSNGNKFVRPIDGNADIELGSASFPFKNVITSAGVYSSNGVYVSEIQTMDLHEEPITADNILDNIYIYPQIQTFSYSSENNEGNDSLIMDVTNIKDTQYVKIEDNGTPYMNTAELVKILIMEIKKVKRELNLMNQ